MKKSKLCVYQCIKNQGDTKFGMGKIKYQKGDYITYEGTPTKNINEAYVFYEKTYILEDTGMVDENFRSIADYFKLIKVKVVPIKEK